MNRKLWMNPQEAAVSLGISVKTLHRCDKAGKLHVARTAANHRCIGMAEIQRFQRQEEQAVRCVLYARVSTFKQTQEGNLARRLERLRVAAAEREYQVVQTIAHCAHTNPRRKKALPMLVSKSEQEERAA